MFIGNIGAIVKAIDAASCLHSIISAYTNATQITEQERTKRREIAAGERLQGLGTFASAFREYKQIAEPERTKRREIEAWEKATLAKIEAQRDLLMEYLDRSFDERAEIFRNLFDVVDRSLLTGNNEQLGLTLHSITELAKSSPFKEMAKLSSVQAALDDPNHEWQF